MGAPPTCPACGHSPPADAAFCSACGAAFGTQPRKRRQGLGRGWRRTYRSSETVGMTVGLIAIGVMVFLFLGLGFVIAAVLLLAVIWILRVLFAPKPVAPSAAERNSASSRRQRVERLVADHRAARESGPVPAMEPQGTPGAPPSDEGKPSQPCA
jgi:hypothetical protein